eukprot:1195013-Prorocentrum_minimum.AAC.15
MRRISEYRAGSQQRSKHSAANGESAASVAVDDTLLCIGARRHTAAGPGSSNDPSKALPGLPVRSDLGPSESPKRRANTRHADYSRTTAPVPTIRRPEATP